MEKVELDRKVIFPRAATRFLTGHRNQKSLFSYFLSTFLALF